MNRKDVLQKYIDLSQKLGKLPSMRDCKRFGIGPDSIKYHYDKITKLREMAIITAPHLESLIAPQPITIQDIEHLRLDFMKKDAKSNNKTSVETANFLDYVEQFSDTVFKGRIKAGPAPKKVQIKRIHTLVLSDLHIGSDIDSATTGGLNYGKTEESRRLAAIVKQAGEYKPQYRKDTKLVIALLGDLIENNMHDARTGAPIAEQVCRAIHLLIQAVGYLGTKYAEIEIHCATGNHDRILSRHPKRAVHGKYDSYATMIYFALKSAVSNVKHIKVHIPKTPIGSYDVFGKKIGFTHADTVIKPGGIYSTVNVKDLEQQMNKINAALPDKDEYSAIVYGHTHIGHVIHLSNGTILIGNGGLPPPEDFAISIGCFESNNGQWIFESVPGYPVGDMRYIRVNEGYDKDATLDAIITPWKEF